MFMENLEISRMICARKKEEEQWILKNVYSYEQFAPRMYGGYFSHQVIIKNAKVE